MLGQWNCQITVRGHDGTQSSNGNSLIQRDWQRLLPRPTLCRFATPANGRDDVSFTQLHLESSFCVNISIGYCRHNRRSSTVNACSNWAFNRTYFENTNSHECDKFQSFQENLHKPSPLQDPEAQASQKPNLPAYQVVHCLNLSDSKHAPHCADSQNWQINVSQAACKACDKIDFYKPTQTAYDMCQYVPTLKSSNGSSKAATCHLHQSPITRSSSGKQKGDMWKTTGRIGKHQEILPFAGHFQMERLQHSFSDFLWRCLERHRQILCFALN